MRIFIDTFLAFAVDDKQKNQLSHKLMVTFRETSRENHAEGVSIYEVKIKQSVI